MQKLLKYVAIVTVVIIANSCITQKKCLQRFPAARDSTYIEKLSIVPIYVPGDTFDLNVPIRCPDQDIVQVENSHLKQVIRILNGKLLSSTEIKPDTIRVPVKEIQIKVNEVKVPEPVKYIPLIYKYAMRICIFLLSGGLLYAGFRVYGFFKK
jgi:hypothetical protein